MIQAELEHNPYLLTTTAKFDGQPPQINSQMEKYQGVPLGEWVQKIPAIFYNEMNGYDFDLLFAGTAADFASIQLAFQRDGVSQEQVRLVHQNVLEDADTKCTEINSLLAWLREHPCRRFNFDGFWTEHRGLFEDPYPYIILRGPQPEGLPASISPEVVESAGELQNTVLTSTPILFFVSEGASAQFRKDLHTLLNRKDVRQEQLFFLLQPTADRGQITRVISDLGAERPQIVKSLDDSRIMAYLRAYPVTEYIHEAIQVFSAETLQISQLLHQENQKSQVKNAAVHKEIHALEEAILSLKQCSDFFVQRNNYTAPRGFADLRQSFLDQLQKWKNRKAKITGETETEAAAAEYTAYSNEAFHTFLRLLTRSYQNAGEHIRDAFSVAYVSVGIDTAFRPKGHALSPVPSGSFPEIETALMEEREISYAEGKRDILGVFKKGGSEENPPLRVVTCHLDQWRAKAAELLLPLADAFITGCTNNLEDYYNRLAEAYQEHLSALIAEKNQAKEQAAAQLSDEERKLQEDNDWLIDFCDQLRVIERG